MIPINRTAVVIGFNDRKEINAPLRVRTFNGVVLGWRDNGECVAAFPDADLAVRFLDAFYKGEADPLSAYEFEEGVLTL